MKIIRVGPKHVYGVRPHRDRLSFNVHNKKNKIKNYYERLIYLLKGFYINLG